MKIDFHLLQVLNNKWSQFPTSLRCNSLNKTPVCQCFCCVMQPAQNKNQQNLENMIMYHAETLHQKCAL